MYQLPLDPFLIILSITFIFVVLVTIVLIFNSFYAFFGKWLNFVEIEDAKKTENVRQEAYNDARDILATANRSALNIIKSATKEAGEILDSSVTIDNATKISLENHLAELSKKQEDVLSIYMSKLLESYKDVFKSEKELGVASIKNLSLKVEGDIKDELASIKNILHEDTLQIEKELEKDTKEFKEHLRDTTVERENAVSTMLAADYDETRKIIEDYEKEKLSKIDDSILSIIYDVSVKTLGAALNVEEHQDLIIRALEEAKKDNKFKGLA
ncbi:MAG: hypothetical protein ACOZAO_06035 [Patescibacteria group bacterium]